MELDQLVLVVKMLVVLVLIVLVLVLVLLDPLPQDGGAAALRALALPGRPRLPPPLPLGQVGHPPPPPRAQLMREGCVSVELCNVLHRQLLSQVTTVSRLSCVHVISYDHNHFNTSPVSSQFFTQHRKCSVIFCKFNISFEHGP